MIENSFLLQIFTKKFCFLRNFPGIFYEFCKVFRKCQKRIFVPVPLQNFWKLFCPRSSLWNQSHQSHQSHQSRCTASNATSNSVISHVLYTFSVSNNNTNNSNNYNISDNITKIMLVICIYCCNTNFSNS